MQKGAKISFRDASHAEDSSVFRNKLELIWKFFQLVFNKNCHSDVDVSIVEKYPCGASIEYEQHIGQFHFETNEIVYKHEFGSIIIDGPY